MIDTMLGRWRWYRRMRQGRWVQYADGTWARTYSQEGRYDTVEWYTDV